MTALKSVQGGEYGKAAIYYQTLPPVQKCTTGAFMPVSGAREMKSLEHPSRSTHTVHSMESQSARQFLLQTYDSRKEDRELGFVIQAAI